MRNPVFTQCSLTVKLNISVEDFCCEGALLGSPISGWLTKVGWGLVRGLSFFIFFV